MSSTDDQIAALEAELKQLDGGSKAPAQSAAPAAQGQQMPAFDGTGPVAGDVPPVDGPVADPVGKAVTAVVGDVAGGAMEAPGAIIRGVSHAIAATGHGIADLIDSADKAKAKLLEGQPDSVAKSIAGTTTGAELAAKPIASGLHWLGDKVAGLFDKPKTVTGGFVEDASQFIAGFAGASRLVGLAGYSGTVLKYGVAGFAAFEGSQEKVSNMIEQYPDLSTPITRYLSAKPGDTEFEGRLKGAIEGMIVGPLADGMFWALKGIKASLTHNVKGAAEAAREVENAITAMKSLDPEHGVPVERKAPAPAEGDRPRSVAADEGIPPVDSVKGPAVAAGTDDALLKDVPRPSKEPPINITPDDVKGIQKAIDSRYSVGGAEMHLSGSDFNFRNISGPEDIKAVVNAISGSLESKMTGMLAGSTLKDGTRVREFKEVQQIAGRYSDLFGKDAMVALDSMARTYNAVKNLDSLMIAHEELMMSSVLRAADMADRALMLKGSPQGVSAAADAYHAANVAAQLVAMAKGTQTEVARALSAKRATRATSEGRTKGWDYAELSKALELNGATEIDDAFLNRLKAFKDNPKGFRKFMEKSLSEKSGDAFSTWYVNSLLSSAVTHTAQFLGNASMLVYGPARRALAGVYQGRGMEAATSMMDEYVGMIHALGPAMRESWGALKTNTSKVDPHSGNHVGPGGQYVDGLSARAWGATKDFYDINGNLINTKTTPVLSAMLDSISAVVNIPSRFMTAGDEFFKQTQYRAFIYEQASREARTRGLDGNDFAQFVANRVETSFDNAGKFTDKPAMQAAREATFTQDLEYGISRWVQGMANEHPAVKLIVPFVRTPVNILRFTWRHTPGLQYLEQGWRQDLHAGGERRAKALAELTMGAAVMTPLVYFGTSGLITGSAPVDPELRKAWEMDGKKEYAVKVGEKWVQFNRLDPLGGIIGLAADYADAVHSASNQSIGDVAHAMVMSTGRFITSKSYLQGVANIVNALYDAQSGRSGRALEAWAEKTAASVIVPSILRASRDDEYLRETRGLMDTIKARLPGYSKDTPPVRNVLGEAVETPKTFGSPFYSPIGWSKEKGNMVNQELAKAMINADSPVSRVMPTLGGTKLDLRDVRLATGQNAYDRLQQLVSDTGIRERLHNLMESPRYKAAADGSTDYPNAPGTKLWLINKYMEAAKETARGKLLQENADLRELWRGEVIRKETSGADPDQPRLFQPPTFLESVFGDPKARTPQGMLDKARNK